MRADEAVLPTELLTALRPHLPPAPLEWLEAEIWRGSIAHAVYKVLRVPAVHQLISQGLSFSRTTFRGQLVARIDLDTLQPALRSLLAHARRVSEATGKWFGVQ